jgi:hypothetical protein
MGIEETTESLNIIQQEIDRICKFEEFRKKLEVLINTESIDNLLNVPDFILAGYIIQNLMNLDSLFIKNQHFHKGK